MGQANTAGSTRMCRASSSRTARRAASCWPMARRSGRPRRLQCRRDPHLWQARAGGRDEAGCVGKLKRASQSMSLFVWYFGTKGRRADVPHHTILLGPRYQGLLDDIFRRKTLAEDFSLYLHRPTATTRASRRPATTPSTCSRRCRTLPAGRTGIGLPRPIASGSPPSSTGRSCPASATRSSPRASCIPAISATSSWRPSAPPSASSRCCCRAPGSGRTTAPRTSPIYLVGAGTHPGAGLPGVLSSARILDQVVPHGSTVAT